MTQQQPDKKLLTAEEKIDWIAILQKIIKIRKSLYKAIGIGLILGILVALSIPKQYTVNVILSPEMGSSKGSNGLAGLAASFLGNGTVMGESVDALNVSLSSDILSSTPFLLELLNMQVAISDNRNIVSLNDYLDGYSSPWWNYILVFPSMIIEKTKSLFEKEPIRNREDKQGTIKLTKEENEKINILKKNITADIDKKTTITNISVTLQNPQIAALVADSVVHKLQEYIINYRTSKSKEDCVYLEKLYKERQQEYYIAQKKYANYVDTHDDLILQGVRTEQERLQNDMNLAYQIYSQVANQLQVARAKVQEEKPVFAIVEPAVVPLRPSGMGMKMYAVLFMFIAVLSTIGWVLLGKDLLNNLKNEIKQ